MNDGSAGAGGTSGNTGKGGSGGRDDTAGTAGAGAGRAGSSGGLGGNACIPEPETNPLSHCEQGPGQPTSECPFAETCRALRCGAPGSQFDASGCRRKECRSDSQCGEDERCVAPPLFGDFDLCRSSVYEVVTNECDACQVTASADCDTPAFCLPLREYPPADDCDISGMGCSALLVAQASVLGYVESFEQGEEPDGEVLEALQRCYDRIGKARESCYPAEGGAGGESSAAGATNGGAGGEAGR